MSTPKLKVYRTNYCGRFERIVAAPNTKIAANLIGVSLYDFRQFGGVTGNPEHIEIATREPGHVWQRSLALGSKWCRVGDNP